MKIDKRKSDGRKVNGRKIDERKINERLIDGRKIDVKLTDRRKIDTCSRKLEKGRNRSWMKKKRWKEDR